MNSFYSRTQYDAHEPLFVIPPLLFIVFLLFFSCTLYIRQLNKNDIAFFRNFSHWLALSSQNNRIRITNKSAIVYSVNTTQAKWKMKYQKIKMKSESYDVQNYTESISHEIGGTEKSYDRAKNVQL